jgi:hypothetical protein
MIKLGNRVQQVRVGPEGVRESLLPGMTRDCHTRETENELSEGGHYPK